MMPTLWQGLLAIAAGSLAGALLRRVATMLLPNAAGAFHFTVSGLGGILLGSLLGWIAAMASDDSAWPQTTMIALAATLGTFAASAVLDTAVNSSTAKLRFRRAAIHITATLLAAALGVALALWWHHR